MKRNTCFIPALLLLVGLAATGVAAAQTGGKVNLNTATAEQLQALPGIGPKTAERIVEFREQNGPFRRVEDLMNVRGIGEKKFLQLKDLLTVGPASSGGEAPPEQTAGSR